MSQRVDDLTELRRVWYARLKASGFDDLETDGREIDPLIRPRGAVDPDKLRSGHYDAVAEYYRTAGQYLHEHRWESRGERRIWALHADGACYSRIARKCNVYRKLVFLTVKKHQALMLGLGGGAKVGRKAKPGGLGDRHAKIISVRLDEPTQAALYAVMERFQWQARRVIREAIRGLASNL